MLRTSKADRDIPSFSSPFKMWSDVIRNTDVTNTCPAHREWVHRTLQCCTVLVLNLRPTELCYAILERTYWIKLNENDVVGVETRLPGGRSTESCLCLLPRILVTSLFSRPSTPTSGSTQPHAEWQRGTPFSGDIGVAKLFGHTPPLPTRGISGALSLPPSYTYGRFQPVIDHEGP